MRMTVGVKPYLCTYVYFICDNQRKLPKHGDRTCHWRQLSEMKRRSNGNKIGLFSIRIIIHRGRLRFGLVLAKHIYWIFRFPQIKRTVKCWYTMGQATNSVYLETFIDLPRSLKNGQVSRFSRTRRLHVPRSLTSARCPVDVGGRNDYRVKGLAT